MRQKMAAGDVLPTAEGRVWNFSEADDDPTRD